MTFLLNGRYRNLQIQINRMDREHMDLKKDYEKLYSAYYSYDKKVLKLLESNPNVYWAEDSSAYMVESKSDFLFAFKNKPNISGEYFLWILQMDSIEVDDGYSYSQYVIDNARIDTLKPHQLMSIDYVDNFMGVIVAPKSSHADIPDQDKLILEINIP